MTFLAMEYKSSKIDGRWITYTFSKVCSVFADGDWLESKDQSGSGFRIIQTGNIAIGEYRDKEARSRYISSSTFERLRCTEVFEGDLLISRLPDPAGRSALLPKLNNRAVTAVDCTIVRPDKNRTTSKFLLYFTNTDRYFGYINSNLTGSTRKRISKSLLAEIKINLPPLHEQSRIVAVLEMWDKAIEKLTKKIEIKKQIKKGLMQELMTGNKRLSGFKEKWQIVELGDVCEVNPKSVKIPDTFIYIDLECVEKGRLLKENLINAIAAPSRAQRVLRPNDIIFQIVRPYQRNNFLFNMKGNYVASTGYAQIRAYYSPEYLYYLVHTDFFVNRVMDRCTGSNYPAINSNDLLKIDVPFPQSKEEQIAIAKIIMAIDQQIILLERSSSLLKDQKKYLLNNLITGRIRTPENMKITKLPC